MAVQNNDQSLHNIPLYVQRRIIFANNPCPYYTPECPEGHCNKYGKKCWFGIHEHTLCSIAVQQKKQYDDNHDAIKLQIKIYKKNQSCKLYPNCRYGTKCKFAHSEEERMP